MRLDLGATARWGVAAAALLALSGCEALGFGGHAVIRPASGKWALTRSAGDRGLTATSYLHLRFQDDGQVVGVPQPDSIETLPPHDENAWGNGRVRFVTVIGSASEAHDSNQYELVLLSPTEMTGECIGSSSRNGPLPPGIYREGVRALLVTPD